MRNATTFFTPSVQVSTELDNNGARLVYGISVGLRASDLVLEQAPAAQARIEIGTETGRALRHN